MYKKQIILLRFCPVRYIRCGYNFPAWSIQSCARHILELPLSVLESGLRRGILRAKYGCPHGYQSCVRWIFELPLSVLERGLRRGFLRVKEADVRLASSSVCFCDISLPSAQSCISRTFSGKARRSAAGKILHRRSHCPHMTEATLIGAGWHVRVRPP